MSLTRQQPKAKSKIWGPYDVATKSGPDGVVCITIPWAEIRNSTTVLSVETNAAQAITQASQVEVTYSIVNVEASIIGSVQGYQTLLRRNFLNAAWGPCLTRLTDDDCFDQIILKARLFIGGKPGIPNDLVLNAPLVVNLTMNVQAREDGREG